MQAWGSLLALLLLATPVMAERPTLLETTLADQDQLGITVYNDGTGLVRDVRTIALPTGLVRLAWRDVASGIVTQSVSLLSLNGSEQFRVLEQNYQYDLVDRSKLIQKYVGKTVQVQLYDYTTETYVVKSGTLLSPNVIEIGGQIYPGIPGQLIPPELPGGLISVPTLEWELMALETPAQTMAMSYLTGGMTWQADYVAVVNADDTALDLNGWATITNNSGTAYHGATLKLIAGDIHRVPPPAPPRSMPEAEEGLFEFPATTELGFEEKSFFEYHMYTLGRPATLRNNEQKQIALFDPAHTPAVKRFIFDGGSDYWYGGDTQKVDVQVKMEFENREELGLGMPLPKGTVRVYKADTDGSLQFIGEDSIDHTPKDEAVRLRLGNAFDIAGERIVADRRHMGGAVWEYDVTVKLRNHKTTPVMVTVLDHVAWGDWDVTKHQGGDYTKKDASTLEFSVRCEPDVETVLTYTIRREY